MPLRTCGLHLAILIALLSCQCTKVVPGECDGECDDAGTDAGTPADAAPDAAGPDAGFPDEVIDSPDFADCVPGASPVCPRTSPMGSLDLGDPSVSAVEVSGWIDDRAHPRGDPCLPRADSDLFELRGEAGSIIEIVARPQHVSGSLAAIVQSFQGPRQLTFASIVPGDIARTARTLVVIPSSTLAVHLALEEGENQVRDPCAAPRDPPVGGPGYGYRITASRTDFGAESLGDLSADLTVAGREIAAPGDLALYYFTTSEAAPSVSVRLLDCPPGPDCVPNLVTLNTFGGQALWGRSTPDSETMTTRSWSEHGADQGGSFYFLVTDFSGHGEMGYTYELTVDIRP